MRRARGSVDLVGIKGLFFMGLVLAAGQGVQAAGYVVEHLAVGGFHEIDLDTQKRRVRFEYPDITRLFSIY